MCGFTGFIDFKGNLIDYEKILKQSSNLINFRGPDESKISFKRVRNLFNF